MTSRAGRRRSASTHALRCAALLAALFASGAAPAQPPAPAPALALVAEPAKVELWQADGTTLLLHGPPQLEDVRFSASVGQVVRVQRLSPGRFRATYLAPEEAWPQRALVSATGRAGGEWQWALLALPLWGRADTEVRATPGAQITLRIGDRSYGPVHADARGIARVPLELAPGETFALHGAARIPLRLPPSRRLHLFSPVDHAAADVASEVPVLLWTVDAQGGPSSTPPGLTAGTGTITLPTEVAPGVWRATWSLPADAADEAILEAALPSEGPAHAARLLLPRRRDGRISLAARAGAATNFADVWAPAARLEAAFRLGEAWGVFTEAGVLRFAGGVRAGPDGRSEGTYGHLLTGAWLRRAVSARVGLRGSLAGGAALVVHRGRAGTGPLLVERAWVPAATARAEVSFGLWRGGPFAGVEATWFGAPPLATLRGPLFSTTLAAGYRLELR